MFQGNKQLSCSSSPGAPCPFYLIAPPSPRTNKIRVCEVRVCVVCLGGSMCRNGESHKAVVLVLMIEAGLPVPFSHTNPEGMGWRKTAKVEGKNSSKDVTQKLHTSLPLSSPWLDLCNMGKAALRRLGICWLIGHPCVLLQLGKPYTKIKKWRTNIVGQSSLCQILDSVIL